MLKILHLIVLYYSMPSVLLLCFLLANESQRVMTTIISTTLTSAVEYNSQS